ncbi:MAG: PepSY-associated TM helix domain-containing protein [Tepidisphaeraceae bacterium]
MRINRSFLAVCRTVHIYLTMFGLLVMLLFGITGFTANHEAWFGATNFRLTELAGETPKDLIDKHDALRIVEHIRASFPVSGAMSSYDELEDQIAIGIRSPRDKWDIEIDRATGHTTVRGETTNFIGLINNLHRGRYSGVFWSIVIDVTALLIAIACFTGVVLWLVLPKRRKLGLAGLAVGVIGTFVIYAVLVPGPDVGVKPSSEAQPKAE